MPREKQHFPTFRRARIFLIGSVRYNNQFLYWDLSVELKAGANSITLDTSSAKPADR
jgi:hypothetical protein